MVYVRLAQDWTDSSGTAYTAGEMVDVDAATLATLEASGVVSEPEPSPGGGGGSGTDGGWAGPSGGSGTDGGWAGPSGGSGTDGGWAGPSAADPDDAA